MADAALFCTTFINACTISRLSMVLAAQTYCRPEVQQRFIAYIVGLTFIMNILFNLTGPEKPLTQQSVKLSFRTHRCGAMSTVQSDSFVVPQFLVKSSYHRKHRAFNSR